METSNDDLHFEIMKTFVAFNIKLFSNKDLEEFVNEKRTKHSQKQDVHKKRGSWMQFPSISLLYQ